MTVSERDDEREEAPSAPEAPSHPRLSRVADRVSTTAVDINDRFSSGLHASARFVAQRWVMKPTVWSITNVTVLGREKLKGLEGGFVLIANHSSHLDAPLIVGALPRKLSRYLATGAAADYFFDVWWRRGLTRLFFNAFPIQRSGKAKKKRSSREDPSVSAASLLQRGFPVLVFPEGTRSKDGTMARFKPGAARLAAACDVPIVPLALIGANIAHPRGSHWPRPGRLPVGVAFGEPMRPMVGENPVAFSERLRDEILRLKSQYSADILGESAPSEGAHP
ncbi:lysophospholipid acyltransferase family protein [Frondihabitans australicus]|uniref:1-acyl-sn-glycerol-3-phosphate acyltransferase n=1 Tax=Frondihabitans australicus TaxID=386892 RepID=A0A495IJX7_9MICO|nr:lysophospholipid acyltransferase family protein [Frondihabitans australicus]RKR76267.1 1-acyl-sn-glycerol-3-phosphate acyltransferase [Frondihabitans australicus]